MWTGMALQMGCLGPRACFTITALSVKLLQHLTGATRPFSPVDTPSFSTEQDTGLEGGVREQKAMGRVKAERNFSVCVTLALSVCAFSYYSSQLSRICHNSFPLKYLSWQKSYFGYHYSYNFLSKCTSVRTFLLYKVTHAAEVVHLCLHQYQVHV